jgi:hypothetical protein
MATLKPAVNYLQVAPGLVLDADYVAGGSLALLGKRGAGKTFAARVLVEELFAAHVQVAVVDPMGVFWGLRASADGEREGLPIPVFGGQHGDAPLEPSAGALMADLVVDEGLSMILDLSGFGSRTQERTFAGAYFDRLYRRNKDLVHLVVDEADLFAPQRPRGQDAPLLATMENIVRRGRNKAIGVTLASQRAQVLHKDVLTQVDALVALRLTAPQDRDAIRDWVRGQGDEEQWATIAPSLPGLGNGESWWWIPEKQILQRVQVRTTRTFDSSPTRKRGQSTRTPKTFADVDLAAISSRIAATIERAKDSDPRELHKRLAELQQQLRARERELMRARHDRPEPPIEQVDALLDRLEKAADALGRPAGDLADAQDQFLERLDAAAGRFAEHAREIAEVGAGLAQFLRDRVGTSLPAPASPEPRTSVASAPMATAPPRRRATTSEPAADSEVSPARQRLLDSLAALESIGVGQVAKTQLALWAGVSPKSSGYSNNLGGLRTAGLITYPGPALVALTDAGRDQADTRLAAQLLSTEELHAHVRQLLPSARWRILEPLLTAYPEAIGKTELAELAGVSPSSSGYSNNLGGLRSLGLVDYPAPGYVAATAVLFLAPSSP